MGIRSQLNRLSTVTTVDPDQHTASIAAGITVDSTTANSQYVVAIVGTITDGTHTPTLQHAADDGTGTPDTWANVPAAQIKGGVFAALASDVNQERAYIGLNRFLRVNTVVAGATTGGEYAIVVVLGDPRKTPL